MMSTENLALIVDILDKIGSGADLAGLSTLFSKLAQVKDYIDQIGTTIGPASPSSGGTDTLFKYLKMIDNKLLFGGQINVMQIERSTLPVATLTTIFSVAGSGILESVFIEHFGSVIYPNISFRIMVDGVQVFNTQGNIAASQILGSSPNTPLQTNLRFTSSFEIIGLNNDVDAHDVVPWIVWRTEI